MALPFTHTDTDTHHDQTALESGEGYYYLFVVRTDRDG